MRNYLKTVDSDWFKVRVIRALFFVLAAFAVLLLRLFYLQVLEGDTFRRQSESNSIRLQIIDPPRGLIFDRRGALIVDNRPSFDLSVIPKDAEPLEDTIGKLSQYIDIPKEKLLSKIKRQRGSLSYRPILLKQDIGRDLLAAVEVHGFDLPGITVNVKPVRHYLDDHNAAHLIGYLSEIGADELKIRRYGDYRPGDFIGKFGIEKALEGSLRGKRGGRQVEVNAIGQVVRVLKTVEAIPGHNITITMDKALQKRAEDLLVGKVGAIIAMVPDTGHILALASAPSFDPNAFVSGMSHEYWSALSSNPDRPMENKGVQGEYPPASVFKIVTAIAGLEEGVIDEETIFNCPGFYAYGDRVFRCWTWKKGGHGAVNILAALAESCDVFFYQTGRRIGIDRLALHSKASGFGVPTGINLDNEARGLVPDEAWKKGRTGTPWQGGDTLSVSIGQSYNLATPIQVLVLTAAVANGGTRYRPLVLDAITSARGELIQKNHPEIIGKLSAGEKTLDIVRRGLWQVVNTPKGTAWRVRAKDIAIAGKTGTAQVVSRKKAEEKANDDDIADNLKAHAWFTAYAPADAPQIAVTVIIEHGEHGSSAAAPLAVDMIKMYLNN